MSEVKYERLYALGEYDTCVEEIEDILVEIRNGNDISKLVISSRLDACALDSDPHILALILEGNADVAKNVILLLRSCAQESEWLENSSVAFYRKIKALTSSSKIIPFTIYLNSLYNTLWLLWARGKFYDEDRDTVYDMLEDCLRKVLLNSDVQAKRSSDEAKWKIVLALLCQVAQRVSHFEIIQCLQITEICILCLHLFLDFKIPDSEKYRSLIFILKDSWSQIKTKYVKSMTENVIKLQVQTMKLFKFGFFEVNETTDYDIERVYECLCITGGLSLFGLNYLQESTDFLTSHPDTCCKFLCNYIQAYVCLQLQELDVSNLYIRRLSHIQMNECAEMQFHLLCGQHAAASGNTICAHLEFTKILPSKQFVYVGLVHILNNLIAAVHTLHDNGGGASALIDKFIQVLRCFYTFITNVSFSEANDKYDAEKKLLSILHKRKSYKMEEVVYVIGKEMLWIKVLHLSSDNSFNPADVAAKCYMDVLCAYYQQDSSMQILNMQAWIIHEAVVAFILSGELDEAEATCQILTQNCTVLKEFVREEQFLMENGVAALMLMAFIKVYQRKFEDAHNILTRIKKILVGVYYTFVKADINPLLDAILAKVYVLKAILFMKTECKLDAFQSCKKAIIHNPDDDIVEECIKIVRKINADISIPLRRKPCLPKQTSVTLQYLLTANVTF